MSSPTVGATGKKVPWIKLAVVAVVLLVGAALVVRGVDLKALLDRGMAVIRAAGPLAFFTAMAIAPAFGVPALTFTLTVSAAFSERLGMGGVIGFSLLAITINLLFTYALARRALRPLLERLMLKLGFKLPKASGGGAMELMVLLRLTPGVPFFVQNYLAGLAEIPFWPYVIVSVVIALPYAVAFIVFGEALLHGRGRLVLLAISVLAVLTVGTHLIRKHYAAKKARA